MTRRKNLSVDDHQDVDTWEGQIQRAELKNMININDIPIKIKCLNEKQKELKKAIEEFEITISIGPAGTGKTYLSLITALHLLKTCPQYRKIVLIKSVQTIKGEELGFLPGTLREKMDPYMKSYTGNLDKILGDKSITNKLIDAGVLCIEPIAYIRGNTVDNSIVVIDETQNIDMHTFKTIITRIGKNSKMVFLGDIEQIDRKNIKESCLSNVFDGFKNKDFIGSIEFMAEDCVRNPIIPKILDILNSL